MLRKLVDDRERGGRYAAILAIVGGIDLPIIKFSVEWWRTLHQPMSFSTRGVAISDDILVNPFNTHEPRCLAPLCLYGDGPHADFIFDRPSSGQKRTPTQSDSFFSNSAMTGFYARWAIMVGGLILLAIMTYHQYQRDLSTISLASVLSSQTSSETVRIQGMVKSGTLSGDLEQGQATFELIDGSTTLSVEYAGPPLENIRELKTMVLIGHLDPTTQTFKAKDTALINNFGFVAAAYLVTVIALICALFTMGQRVMMLFKEIKEEKLYEPENEPFASKE